MVETCSWMSETLPLRRHSAVTCFTAFTVCLCFFRERIHTARQRAVRFANFHYFA